MPTSTGRNGLPRGTVAGRLILGMLVVFVMMPLVWLAYSAFLPKDAVFSGATVPVGLSLENFLELPYRELLRPLLVSLALSSAVAVLALCIALPAAYALRAGAPALGAFLLLLAIPPELLLIPLYGLLQDLRLLNTGWALVVPFVASPFTVFLLYSGLLRLPWTFVEAARLDGATELQILRRVVAPLLRPELTAAAVLAFAAHWNLVLYPRVVTTGDQWQTVQVALTELLRRNPNSWGTLGAAALVTSLPILVLYLFFERRVTRTIEGGLK